MKSLLLKTFSALFLSLITLSTTSAGNVRSSENNQLCLEVLGIAVDGNNDPINGVHVKLFKENDELEWIEITNVMYHDHSFNFNLNANEYYTIEISKPGYITRSIAISTKLPSSVKLDILFHYEFEVELFKEKKNVDDYYLDFPVGLISYDAKRDVFDNNYAYTKHIKTHIKESIGEVSDNR